LFSELTLKELPDFYETCYELSAARAHQTIALFNFLPSVKRKRRFCKRGTINVGATAGTVNLWILSDDI
jgi:hypothetical protein